jgi:CBS domain-containing protein
MPQNIRDVMTSNPCTIDAEKSVAYAAKMMQEEDVGLAPIVEGDRLIGMLTDRDIATRVAAEGRDPDQVKVRDVASTQLVTIGPRQDLDDALRMMAKHQVRRLPVVGEDGRLVGVVAQADIARTGDDSKTGQLVEEISESGGQMSSFEEGQQYPRQVEDQPETLVSQEVEPGQLEAQPEEEAVSKVQAASSRGRKRRTTSRKRSTTRKSSGGARKRKTTSRKKSSTGARKRKTTTRKRSTAKRKTAARKSTGTRKRKTTGRKKAAGTRKRKTTSRKRSTAKRSTAKRKTAARRSTASRKTSTRRRTTRRKTR